MHDFIQGARNNEYWRWTYLVDDWNIVLNISIDIIRKIKNYKKKFAFGGCIYCNSEYFAANRYI